MASCFSTTTRAKFPDRVVAYVKPASLSEESKRPYYLSPWDLLSLNSLYAQYGLLFDKPDNQSVDEIVDRLKNSLATTLVYFFPFSGRLVTENIQNPPAYRVYVDCNDSPGAGFVHAVADDLHISDILTPADVPVDIIGRLFGLDPGVTNNQGHTLPLLVVQVTQLADGIFISFSANHCLLDGTSYWHFVNSYSEICRNQNSCVLLHPPVTKHWFLNDQWHIPGSNTIHQGSVTQLSSAYRQRVFHFTSESITKLKAKAHVQYSTDKISSNQALAGLIWRAVTRARGLGGDQLTSCRLAINCRSRLEPPLPWNYFGFCLVPKPVSCRVNELLNNNLGWTAWALRDQISSCNNDQVRSFLEEATSFKRPTGAVAASAVYIGSSPRFDVYGNDFGWGRPMAVRSYGDLVDGYVHVMPGRDKGSVDLIMTLFSKAMDALELDNEFIDGMSAAILSKI